MNEESSHRAKSAREIPVVPREPLSSDAEPRSLAGLSQTHPMDSNWQSVLDTITSAPSEGLDPNVEATAEAAAVLEGDALSLLTDYGVVRVHGADAEPFLQGQFTADISAIDSGTSCLTAWCTPKGRVILLCRLLREGDEFVMLLPAAQVADCLRRLRLYVLRADVTVESDPDTVVIGLVGEQTRLFLDTELGMRWPDGNEVNSTGGFSLVGLGEAGPNRRSRALLLGPQSGIGPVLLSLFDHVDVRAVSPSGWKLLEVESGQPWLEPVLSEQFLPQMLNLDHLNAVSFDKGCYVGQEIIARTQYLGRLKRRLYKARVQSHSPPLPGDVVYTRGEGSDLPGTDAIDHAAGTILAASVDQTGDWAVLAVCTIGDAQDGKLRLHHVLGPPLEIEPLPYAVDGSES